MKALCWHGKEDIRYDTVPDPEIEHPRDAIIKMTCCAICGSDLHFFDGFMPGMKSGDVVGHEFMGEVVEVGAENRKLKVGDRVVVPFTICCGDCEQCRRGNWSVCERTNRKKDLGDLDLRPYDRGPLRLHPPDRRLRGRAGRVRACPLCRRGTGQDSRRSDRRAGALPRRHLPDRLAGGGAVRHPADRHGLRLGRRPGRPVRDPERRDARRRAGDLRSTTSPERLDMARAGGAITIDFDEESVLDRLQELTAGKGPEKCIDAVGMEAHCVALARLDDRPRQAVGDDRERPASRAARDDVRLPPGRHAVDRRRLRRPGRQDPVRRRS